MTPGSTCYLGHPWVVRYTKDGRAFHRCRTCAAAANRRYREKKARG